ncbi:MAG: hypothetical protein L0210_02785 [Rhodospirillales bacterium]|nr:hypothetical protein [Rhodospirillales bacterium]
MLRIVQTVFLFLSVIVWLIGSFAGSPGLLITALGPSAISATIGVSPERIADVALALAALHLAALWGIILALKHFRETAAAPPLALACAALVLLAIPATVGMAGLLWDMIMGLEWPLREAFLDRELGELQSVAGFVFVFALPVLLLLGLAAAAVSCVRFVREGPSAFADWPRACASALAGGVLAYAIAVMFGADPVQVIRQSWFYVLLVPAVAGVGIGACAMQWSNRWFPFAAIGLAALMAHYALTRGSTDYYGVRCAYEVPRHMVMGFFGAPWQWRPPYLDPDWLQASGIVSELTVRSIFLPLKQSDCPF